MTTAIRRPITLAASTPIGSNWQANAPCNADPDLFFPDPSTPDEDIARAKQICAGCPVRAMCLEDAFRRGDRDAICGGLTYAERDQLLHPERLVNRFQQRRHDVGVARQVAMECGADLLVWLVRHKMPVADAAERLGVPTRAVFLAFMMLVPAAGERAHSPTIVERVLADSSLTMRTLHGIGRSHEQIARSIGTSQNVVSACIRVLEQRDAALNRLSQKGLADAVKRLQGEEKRVRHETRCGLTVTDVIEVAGTRILALHDEGMTLKAIARELGFNREIVRRAYAQITAPRATRLVQQDDMERAA